MTTTANTTRQPVEAEPTEPASTVRVWRGAALAAATSVLAVEIYAVIARNAGVPMKAGFLGATTASPVTFASFATGVLVCTFWAAVLSTIFARKAARPVRTFALAAASLTVASVTVPATAALPTAACSSSMTCGMASSRRSPAISLPHSHWTAGLYQGAAAVKGSVLRSAISTAARTNAAMAGEREPCCQATATTLGLRSETGL